MTRRFGSRNDSGAVAVTVAICLVMFMMFAAVVVDVGYMYNVRRQLQSAADAAALTGCQVLIQTNNTVAADAAARDYVTLNATGPAANAVVIDVDVNNDDPDAGWVRVEVGSDAQAFFSQVWPTNPDSNPVGAVAKAQKQRLTGGRYLIPWGVPIIEVVGRIEARLEGGSARLLSPVPGESLHWTGTLTAPAAGQSKDAFVRVFNHYDIPEVLATGGGNQNTDAPVALVTARNGSSKITSIELSKDFLTSDGSARSFPTELTVRTAAGQNDVRVRVGTKKLVMSGSGTLWTRTITAADASFTDDMLTVIPLDVSFGTGNNWDGVDAYLHVRRSTLPYDNVVVTPLIGPAAGTVQVDVYLSSFSASAEPGRLYTLRVSPQGNAGGNFGELNFNSIVHTPDCPDDPDGVKSGTNYRDNVANGYAGGIHIGDVITMSPGGSGANTDKALDDRLLRMKELIVAVPVVEKVEAKTNGAYEVVVTGFAAFRIHEYTKDGDVQGEFIKFAANPSEFEEPGEGTESELFAARLVNP